MCLIGLTSVEDTLLSSRLLNASSDTLVRITISQPVVFTVNERSNHSNGLGCKQSTELNHPTGQKDITERGLFPFLAELPLQYQVQTSETIQSF